MYVAPKSALISWKENICREGDCSYQRTEGPVPCNTSQPHAEAQACASA